MADTATPVPTSKYAEERQSIDTFVSLQNQRDGKEAQAKKDNDYTIMFDQAYDKIVADSNQDGKIDYNEYKAYIVKTHDSKTSVLQSNRQEDNNNNTNQNYYHFDSSLLIAIGMACLTTIIVSWIKKNKNA